MSYDIIKSNLNKLEKAIETFPDILGKYKSITNVTEKADISAYASKLNLSAYINFIDWVTRVSSNGEKIIYDIDISFDTLKSAMIESSTDSEVIEFLKKKTKRGLISFINSPLYSSYNGGMKGRRGHRKYYDKNFSKCECLLSNYILQNSINLVSGFSYGFGSVGYYYTQNIPDFESELNTEIEITNDITKSIIRKINTLKYDFRKINFNLLKTEIENQVKSRMCSVLPGEEIKCIEASQNLTLNNLYKVVSYQISISGNLMVHVLDDNERKSQYNYRLFETVSKLREDSINDILNFI